MIIGLHLTFSLTPGMPFKSILVDPSVFIISYDWPAYTSCFLSESPPPESHLCVRGHICPLLIQDFLPSFLPALLFLPFTGYFLHTKVLPKEALHRGRWQALHRKSRKVWGAMSLRSLRVGRTWEKIWDDGFWSWRESIYLVCIGFTKGWVLFMHKVGKPDVVLLILLTLIHSCLLKLWFESLLTKNMLNIC